MDLILWAFYLLVGVVLCGAYGNLKPAAKATFIIVFPAHVIALLLIQKLVKSCTAYQGPFIDHPLISLLIVVALILWLIACS